MIHRTAFRLIKAVRNEGEPTFRLRSSHGQPRLLGRSSNDARRLLVEIQAVAVHELIPSCNKILRERAHFNQALGRVKIRTIWLDAKFTFM